jgi:4-hydroxybenzoate polyprenyltransferase
MSNAKNIAVVVLAFYLSGGKLNLVLFFLGVLALSLVFSSTYAYNTVCDAGIDRSNRNKRHYSESVVYFGRKKAILIVILLAFFGLAIGVSINIYFFSVSALILLTGFFYSSPYVRFKERVYLDVLFGAILTFSFRFVASWFIFKISFPPLLPLFALAFLKSGGYMLYKEYDRPFLMRSGVRNTITFFSTKSILLSSVIFFCFSILMFMIMCFERSLPLRFLWFLILFIPPILIQYLIFFKKITISAKYLRVAGLILLLILAVAVMLMAN